MPPVQQYGLGKLSHSLHFSSFYSKFFFSLIADLEISHHPIWRIMLLIIILVCFHDKDNVFEDTNSSILLFFQNSLLWQMGFFKKTKQNLFLQINGRLQPAALNSVLRVTQKQIQHRQLQCNIPTQSHMNMTPFLEAPLSGPMCLHNHLSLCSDCQPGYQLGWWIPSHWKLAWGYQFISHRPPTHH